MPKLPILSPRRRRARLQADADQRAFLKAAGAVAQTLSQAGLIAPGHGLSSSGSWYNAGNASMLQRSASQALSTAFQQPGEEVEAALAEQGLSWTEPFGPGRPLSPALGYRVPARVRDYTVGENVQITPRFGRISFPTLKGIYGAWDIPQICVQRLVNDVRTLKTAWVPMDGVKTDVSSDVETAERFFAMPDRRRPFFSWLAMWLQDILRWDAGALYVRRNNLGEPIALEVVDGTTIIPYTDFYGRIPMDEDDGSMSLDDLDLDGDVVPAYVQVIQGMPFDWFTADDIIYQPLNPVSESQYGLAPIEKILLAGNTDIRFQWHFLNYFTEGSLPAGFMEAPPDMSDPAQIQQWQELWDEIMIGDQTKLRQIRWVPSGSKFDAVKNSDFNPEFPLYLMRKCCAAYGETPADMGFTEDVNRATGDTQIDVQFRVGTSPPMRHVEAILSLFAQRDLGLKVKLQIDDGREVEDRVATAQAHSIYINDGVESPDEVRDELGLQTDKTQAVGRFLVTRTGVVPLEALLGQSKNPIDPETFAPDGKVDYVEPVAPPAPGAPAPGSPAPIAGGGDQPAAGSTPAGQKPAVPGGADASNADTTPPAAKAVGDEVLVEGYPAVVTAVFKDSTGIHFNVQRADGVSQYRLSAGELDKEATAGVTAATGLHGSDLPPHRHLDDEDDDAEDDDVATKAAVRRWRTNTLNRLRKGRAPREFTDPAIGPDVAEHVWGVLKDARTRDQVDTAFRDVLERGWLGKAAAAYSKAADFHASSDDIAAHYGPLIAAALRALVPKAKLEAAARGKASKAVVESPAAGDEDSAAILAELEKVVNSSAVAKLTDLVTSLYGDAALQAAHHASQALGASLADWVTDLDMPADYWDKWTPGWGEAAAKVAGGGLKDLLDEADVTIKGMTDTTLARLGNTLADGISSGDSIQTVASAALDMGADPGRALTIANTEMARAMSATSDDTYQANGVAKVDWLAEDDACPDCQDNADGGPYPLADAPYLPAHPVCRCAKSPADN